MQLQKCVCHNAAPRCPTVPHRRGRARPPATAFTAAVSGGDAPGRGSSAQSFAVCQEPCLPVMEGLHHLGRQTPYHRQPRGALGAPGQESRAQPWVRRVGGSGSIQLPGARTHPPGVHTGGPHPGGCNRLCKSEPPSAGLCSQGPDFTPEMGSPHHRRGVPADRQT